MVRSTVVRGWSAAAAGFALLVTTMGSGAAGASGGLPAAPTPPPDETVVSADVLADLEERGRADYWVRFAERPDLSPMQQISDWDQRGQAVYDALASTAEESQAQLRADLDAAGTRYTSYVITNAVLVHAGDEASLHSAAALPGVEGIYPTRDYEPPDHRPGELTAVGPLAVEWGVTDIRADQVWSEIGVLGEDIVVANLDTGVQFDHPALVNSYRGNNGDGTFTHDYNWFDGAAFSPDEPADYDGHGTHTAGTMAGDDGGNNQIGVAPGARWIAAGTDWSDASLFAAGEWFLAPTDLSGGNPDPAMRPHIINNSWGVPDSTDPFMPDILAAWEASGMFGVWAAGNEGPTCETLRTPPRMQTTYATGAYDAAREISSFSSRGPGENGETKPNIAAPGEGVRSSVPGNDYAVFDGTSMAAPHLTGAIALMWSASPAMIGDVAGTKDLLDETASDAPDLQCGGTDDDNNVYGEGRLDAYELVLAAPVGDVGTLEGTVTDAATGDPIPGVRLTLTGPQSRTLTSGADGAFRARLLAGDFTVTASKFGWITETTTVTVPVEGTVVLDIGLDAAPTGTLSGTVTDGSGHGFPLYARVSVAGTTLFTYTDPVDGTYSLDLPLDTYAQIIVDAQYPGYTQGFREVQLSGDSVEDFALEVDVLSCVANGYTQHTVGLTETFDGPTAPPGWTVEDNLGNGQVWVFEDLGLWGNQTGGEGGFAVVDSDNYGPEGQQDTSLVSPSVDLTGVANPTLSFRHFYLPFGERADVDVSHDGGATWQTILTAGQAEGVQEILEVPVADDMSDVRVRFHYYDAFWALLWQVDDVFVGEYSCLPDQPGGYVVGNVYSSTTGDPVRGAIVTSVNAPQDRAISVDTPADENLDDGFYWLFSTLTGTTPFEATARRMSTETQDVDVPDSGAVRADFELGSGLLEVDPEQIGTEVVLGEEATVDLTVTNSGDAAAEVELREVRGGFEMLRADGTRLDTSRLGAGAPLRTVEVEASTSALSGAAETAAEPAERQPAGPAEEPWTDLTSLPLPVIDNRAVNLDGEWYSIGGTDGFEGFADVFRYDAESMSWGTVAALPEAAWATTAGVVGGQIVVSGGWRPDGNTSGATYAYDPAADSWSQVADNPSAVSAAGQAVADGLLYSIGGCSTGDCVPMSSAVTAYDAAADQWLELADYPVAAAFASCGALDGQVVCTGGTGESADVSATYSYDPATDSWSEVAEAPAPWWGSSYAVANGMLVVTGGIINGEVSNEALGYDPSTDSWTDLPNPNTPTYRGAAACGFVRIGGDLGGWAPTDAVEYLPGFDDCGADGADVDWLSLSETMTVLDPGESWTVQVTTDGAVPQPGTYTAGISVVGGLPGTDPVVPVTMEVLPPNAWGKIMGTVSGESCEGVPSPLPGAAVTLVPTDGGESRWYLTTDGDGQYARWIDTRVGELEITAFLAGFFPESVVRSIPRGLVTVQDFDLLDAECGGPVPVHPDVLRLSGADRYQTAVAVSSHYEPGLDTVFLATGAAFPDALTGSAVAGSLESPVLLTKPDRLPQATEAELRRLRPSRVVVLGGSSAISGDVLQEVQVATGATVERWSGSDRYRTAAVVSGHFASADVVYVATGQGFPDALAGSARAGALDAPVLLVRHGSVPSATIGELQRLAPTTIRVLGGDTAISDDVVAALGAYGTVERIVGADRYATAALISGDYPTAQHAFVANGMAWPDAVTASALAGRWEAPLLLVKQNQVPNVTWDELDRLDPETVFVMGGAGVVSEAVADQLRTLE
ncbi:cell wall-binding repeat-containing protein [Ornithinimicrobium sp. F0845]|uniref:cell wall-binding repeat-containing protein n=1 Tax=Ornithinimicrobium sp. F0845 TaxID=2926412 RepID=UPI001FF12929|nr:cell wall-binding repeat-containing protein [Ornithinimicrobium sp. F0845]MCK0111445.1 cell wall-binding repeat-containing protein [Ornithinimicrobium sp. F0845]